jgi:hypothetical protein
MQVGFIGRRTGYRVMVIKFQVPQNVGNFIISSANINFSRTLLCGVSYKLGDLFYGCHVPCCSLDTCSNYSKPSSSNISGVCYVAWQPV